MIAAASVIDMKLMDLDSEMAKAALPALLNLHQQHIHIVYSYSASVAYSIWN